MILHIFCADLRFESRLRKEIDSVLRAGLAQEVAVLGLHREGLVETESISSAVTFYRLRLATQSLPKNLFFFALKYMEWLLRGASWALRNPPRMIHCHSLPALPLGLLIKILLFYRRIPLIYDAHELESEQAGHGHVKRALFKAVESFCFRGVNHLYVVSHSIAHWYRDRISKRIRIFTIRNAPVLQASLPLANNTLRREFGIPDGAILFIYQGLFGEGRGIPEMLAAFASLKRTDFYLVCMGYGPYESAIAAASRECPHIFLKASVPPSAILELTAGCDIGFCLLETKVLSYAYALPNKMFEYLMCGVPMIISDGIEMRREVADRGLGWMVSPMSELCEFLENLSAEEITKKRVAANSQRHMYGWHNEEGELLSSYRLLLS